MSLDCGRGGCCPKVRALACLLPPPPVPQPSAAAVCCRHAVLHRRPVRGLGCAFCAGGFLGRVVAPCLRPGLAPGAGAPHERRVSPRPPRQGRCHAARCGAARLLAAQTGPALKPPDTPCTLCVKPPDMRGQPVAAASPPSMVRFRCGEPSAVARDVPPRWLALFGIDPLTHRCRCRRAQAARRGEARGLGDGSVAESPVRLPSGPRRGRPRLHAPRRQPGENGLKPRWVGMR